MVVFIRFLIKYSKHKLRYEVFSKRCKSVVKHCPNIFKDLCLDFPLRCLKILFSLKQSFPERLSNIKNQHDKIEGRLKDLQKFQSGLQGKMQFMELTVNCLERIMSELEKDSGFCVSRLHQTSGNGNLKERVTELQNRVSKIINRVERVEPHILSSTLPNSQSTLLESQG